MWYVFIVLISLGCLGLVRLICGRRTRRFLAKFPLKECQVVTVRLKNGQLLTDVMVMRVACSKLWLSYRKDPKEVEELNRVIEDPDEQVDYVEYDEYNCGSFDFDEIEEVIFGRIVTPSEL